MICDSSELKSSTPGTIAEASSGLQEYLSVSQQRNRLFPRAVLVGLCAGIIAVIFRALLTVADTVQLCKWVGPLAMPLRVS